jgi:hypothetical protein
LQNINKHTYTPFIKMAANKKVNYVITTYAGTKCVSDRNPFKNQFIPPENYLKYHLEKLINLNHNIDQVTIMKAKVSPNQPKWQNYYKIDELIVKLKQKCNVEIYEVENQGISYGQFIRAFKLCNHKSFDYWIFMEDDYIPILNNFDSILIDLHKTKGGGAMCALAAEWKRHRTILIPYHMAHSLCIIDNESMNSVFRNVDKRLNELKPSYQQSFSRMFTGSKINVTDFSSHYYTPFWNGILWIDCSFKKPVYDTAIFAPIQITNVEYPSLPTNSNAINDFSTIANFIKYDTIDFSSIKKHHQMQLIV